MIARIDTPSSRLWICGDSTAVNALSWNPIEGTGHTGEMDWIVSALDAYFNKKIQNFPGGLCFHGGMPVWSRYACPDAPATLFHKILYAMSNIPYGETVAYSDIAESLGNKYLARAVGQACKRNPLPVIVPCHRVVGKHSLGGFSSGIARKKALLKLEGAF